MATFFLRGSRSKRSSPAQYSWVFYQCYSSQDLGSDGTDSPEGPGDAVVVSFSGTSFSFGLVPSSLWHEILEGQLPKKLLNQVQLPSAWGPWTGP